MCDPEVDYCGHNTYGDDCFHDAWNPIGGYLDNEDSIDGGSGGDEYHPTEPLDTLGTPNTAPAHATTTNARKRRNADKPTASIQVGPIMIGSKRKWTNFELLFTKPDMFAPHLLTAWIF